MDFNDYGQVKSSLFVDVVGTERNQEMLSDAPHTNFEDLSMVYRIRFPVGEDGFGSVLVSNSMLERFGVDKEQLHRDALENAPQIRPAAVRTMGSVLGMPGGSAGDGDAQLYVVTTEDMYKGAAAIFYPGMMQACDRMLAQDYYILPSSVHEVLLLPDDGKVQAEELQRMVTEINGMVVEPHEQLTDSVYHYDSKERVFELGSKYEARRDAVGTEQEKPASVLGDLRDRQKEAEVKPRMTAKSAAHEAAL